MSLRSITLAIVLLGCGPKAAPTTAQPSAPGTLAGTVNFTGAACQEPKGPPCDGPYPSYEVVIYAEDGTTVVTKTKTGADGAFSLDLPPGKYVIFTQAGIKETDKRRTDVVVSRDAVAKVDLRVDTGVR